jgi:hypothetical protein
MDESHELNMMRTPPLNVRQFPTGEDLAARAQAIKAKAMVRAMPTRRDTGQEVIPFPEGGQESKWKAIRERSNAARERGRADRQDMGYSDHYDYDMSDDERYDRD